MNRNGNDDSLEMPPAPEALIPLQTAAEAAAATPAPPQAREALQVASSKNGDAARAMAEELTAKFGQKFYAVKINREHVIQTDAELSEIERLTVRTYLTENGF